MKKVTCLALSLSLAASALNAAPLSPTAKATNDFGVNLFLKIRASEHEKNAFFSPVSASQAMTLLLAGTRGKTFESVSAGLGYGRSTKLSEILAQSSKEIEALTKNSDAKNGLVLEIANSVWANKGRFKFSDSYLDTVQKSLASEVKELNFRAAGASKDVNKWASDKTHGKITQVIQDAALAANEALLMNASYFKGDWTYPFEANETREQLFKGLKSSLTVKMMSNGYEGAPLRFLENANYAAVELPYGKRTTQEAAASMIVVQPKDYEKFTAKLSADQVSTIVENVQAENKSSVAVQLPKFSFSAEYFLNDVLKASGLASIFAGGDFSGMIEQGPFAVDFVKQNTFVAVDEKGTEAAAVTTIGIRATSVPRPALRKMVVDSPFLVIIKSNVTGAVLFIGSIVEPKI